MKKKIIKPIRKRKIKRFKHFIAYHEKDGEWSMKDIFKMLDYLAEKIEKLK